MNELTDKLSAKESQTSWETTMVMWTEGISVTRFDNNRMHCFKLERGDNPQHSFKDEKFE